MPLFALIKQNIDTLELTEEKFNLSKYGIFTRGSIKDFIKGVIKTIAPKLPKSTELIDMREKFGKEEFKIVIQARKTCRYFAITDGKYSTAVANKLMGRLFNNESFDSLIEEFSTWEDKDNVKRVEEELEKTQVVVMEGLAQVLDRGETLAELVEKSEHLSVQTKMLFKAAKKKNSCC